MGTLVSNTVHNKNSGHLFHKIILTTDIWGPFNHVCMPTEFDVNQGLWFLIELSTLGFICDIPKPPLICWPYKLDKTEYKI